MTMLRGVYPPRNIEWENLVSRIVGWSEISRRTGLLGLEPAIERESDPFIRKGLQLLVDGTEPDAMRSVLEVEVYAREHTDIEAAKVYENAGAYSPTMGIIGAVMGLMSVMQNLADPSKLGHGIAAAFVATIYGIAFANMIFLPWSNKLKSVIHGQTQVRTMVIEGIIAIAQGENPRNIESKLQGYIH